MENNVQNIELIIPLPDIAKNLGVASTSTYKISGIDILYKESEALSVKVLDSVDSTEFSSINKRDLDYYVYDYQSRKPYKTLPSIQTTRVYVMFPGELSVFLTEDKITEDCLPHLSANIKPTW